MLHLCAAYNDAEALRTWPPAARPSPPNSENVNADAMRELAKTTRVSPSGDCVAIAQDRIAEKPGEQGRPAHRAVSGHRSVEDIQVELAPTCPAF